MSVNHQGRKFYFRNIFEYFLSAFSQFIKGFLTPSLKSIFLSFLLAFTTIGVFWYMLVDELIWNLPEEYVLSGPTEWYIDNTWTTYNLKERASNDIFYIIFTGGSNIRRAFFSESRLSLRLTNTLKFPVKIINLAAAGQTYADVISILDTIGSNINGMIIMGTSVSRFNKKKINIIQAVNGEKALLSSKRLSIIANSLGIDIDTESHSVFSRYSSYISTYIKTRINLLINPKRYCYEESYGKYLDICLDYYQWPNIGNRLKVWWMRDVNNTALKRRSEFKLQRKAADLSKNHRNQYFWNKEINKKLLLKTISLAKENNLDVVLMNQPLTYTARESLGDAFIDFQLMMDELCRELSILCWDELLNADFDDLKDFVDLTHLSLAGKIKYEEIIYKKLYERLADLDISLPDKKIVVNNNNPFALNEEILHQKNIYKIQ